MTRITLRSRGAPVRNPLPSLYSGLCCTPVHSAVHLYSTPGAPGLRYHSQSPLVAISRTRSMPRSHLTGIPGSRGWSAVTTPGPSNYGAQALPMLFVSLQVGRPQPLLTAQLGMNAEAGLGCAGVTGVSCQVSLLSRCVTIRKYSPFTLNVLQRINDKCYQEIFSSHQYHVVQLG